jgi:hypothetical protein
MKKISLQEAIDQYLETGRICTEATMSGDYKRNNASVKQLHKVSMYLDTDKDLATQVFTEIMDSDVDYARVSAARGALRLRILTERAVAVLEEVAQRDDMVGFGAEMVLKRWRREIPGQAFEYYEG